MQTRRAFLSATAASGLFAVAPATLRGQPVEESVDVAIVGAGVAGLYCAMRLRAETNQSIAVYEATDRIGGRLISLHFPGVPSQTAEIGGMRLRGSDDIALKIVRDLIGADALQDFVYPTTGYYLRDRLLSDVSDPAQLPYFLDAAEKKIVESGDDLLVNTIKAMAKQARSRPDKFRDQGVWEVLLKLRSKDGLNFVRDILGYDSIISNWGAQPAVPWFEGEFTPGTRYHKLKGGLERIPHAAARAFVSQGGPVHRNHKLRRMDQDAGGTSILTFATTDGLRRVRAQRVILALPPHALESIERDSMLFSDPRFLGAMNAVHKVPLAKIHMAFASDWWRAHDLPLGRQVTDLPVRQIYRWGRDPNTGGALLMASYHDGPLIEYWNSLDVGPAYGPENWIKDATGPNGGKIAASLQKKLPAPEPMVLEAWRQVREAHGLADDLPPPIAATYQNWGREPWGAAVHFWSVLSDPEAVTDYLLEPYPAIHVCNEAWSEAQGWVHGATLAAEAVLTRKFALPAYVKA